MRKMALENQENKESFMEKTDNSTVSKDFDGTPREFYLTHVLRHKSAGHIVNVRAKLKLLSQFPRKEYYHVPDSFSSFLHLLISKNEFEKNIGSSMIYPIRRGPGAGAYGRRRRFIS